MGNNKKDKIIEHLKLLKAMGLDEVNTEMKSVSLAGKLKEEIEECQKCRLWKSRTNPVVGEGPLDSEIFLIGEAPGKEEDKQGKPFVGPAGKLLDKILNRAGIKREEVYITNVVKSRPPGNRNPRPDEIKACNEYLRKQIEIIQPSVVVLMGNIALSLVTGSPSGITKKRGRMFEYQSVPAIPTFHPAYVIRNPQSEELVVSDFKRAAEVIY